MRKKYKKMEVSKFLYLALVNFNLMLFTLCHPRFCFMISLLTAFFIVYIPYWSTMNISLD